MTTSIDTAYVTRLAAEMRQAADWGNGTRSSAWRLAQDVADICAERDRIVAEATEYTDPRDVADGLGLPEAVAAYAAEAHRLALQVAATELRFAPDHIADRIEETGADRPDIATDMPAEALAAYVASLTDEQIRHIGAAPDQSEGTRGWVIDDGQLRGWATIRSLHDDDHTDAEVTLGD